MGQLPFQVTCGVASPTPGSCPTGQHLAVDVDGNGVGIEYGITTGLPPCKAPLIDSKAPPNLISGATWDSGAWSPVTHQCFDAAHPTQISTGAYPLPPHCWGWEGADDYCRLTYYRLATTILQVIDNPGVFGSIDRVTVTVDYDTTLTRRYTQRKLAWFRSDFFHNFDLSAAPATDVCTDLSTSSVTTHHTQTVFSTEGPLGLGVPSGTWNSLDLALADVNTANAQDGSGFLCKYAFSVADYQDSTYVDTTVTPTSCFGAGQRGHWGNFSAGYGPTGRGVGGGSLEWNAIYLFGRETQVTSNVRFTVSVGWKQYHCDPDGSGTGDHDCNCNHDCEPCQGVDSVNSGKCATLCANGGVSDTALNKWSFVDQNGNAVDPTGWTFSLVSKCQIMVCAPCLPPARLRANDYQGPYTVSWGGSDWCVCNNTTKYKIYSASFTLVADVICPEITPVPGREVSYDVSDARRHARGFVANQTGGVPGKVKIGIASNVIPLDWGEKDFTTDLLANRLCLRWDRQSEGSYLYLLRELNGAISLLRSQDEGQSWTPVADVAAKGKRPVLVMARDGRRFCFWQDQGYLWQLVYDSAGNIVGGQGDSGTDPTRLQLAPDDDYMVDEAIGANGQWSLPLWMGPPSGFGAGSTHPTGFSARDGRRFYFWVQGGQILCEIHDTTGTRIAGPYGAAFGDDAQPAADETVERDGTWWVTLLYLQGGSIQTKSSRDGVRFG